jgi:hypothetical protein
MRPRRAYLVAMADDSPLWRNVAISGAPGIVSSQTGTTIEKARQRCLGIGFPWAKLAALVNPLMDQILFRERERVDHRGDAALHLLHPGAKSRLRFALVAHDSPRCLA